MKTAINESVKMARQRTIEVNFTDGTYASQDPHLIQNCKTKATLVISIRITTFA